MYSTPSQYTFPCGFVEMKKLKELAIYQSYSVA